MKYLAKLSGEYIVEADDEEDAYNKLADQIEYNNSTIGTEFFDSLTFTMVDDDINDMAPSIVEITNLSRTQVIDFERKDDGTIIDTGYVEDDCCDDPGCLKHDCDGNH